MFNGLNCWIINLLAMLTLNNFFKHRVSTANFHFLIIIIFHFGLYCRVVSITDNLCTKQGNSSIFGPKSEVYIREGFKSRTGYNIACSVF